jgi:hypothetical protein
LLTRRWEKAALHRRSFGGEDSEAFQRLGSALLITTPMLLALHVAAELYVLFDKGLTNSISASIAGLGDWLVMTVFGTSSRWNSNHDIGPPLGAR